MKVGSHLRSDRYGVVCLSWHGMAWRGEKEGGGGLLRFFLEIVSCCWVGSVGSDRIGPWGWMVLEGGGIFGGWSSRVVGGWWRREGKGREGKGREGKGRILIESWLSACRMWEGGMYVVWWGGGRR